MRKCTSPYNLRITLGALAAAFCLGLTTIGLSTTTSMAGERGYPDQVVAQSHYGNGAVVGSVRQTRLGPQVQTPGGNWLYCRRSCSETLRVNTVDFWSYDGRSGGHFDQEDGLLSRWLTWPRRH